MLRTTTRTALSFAMLAILLLLAACGGQTQTPAAKPSPTPSTPAPSAGSQAPAPPGGGKAIAPVSLRLMTGPQGGSWYPLGGAIAELIQKEIPGVTVTVMPGAGIANVKAIQDGKAELGFGNANSTADGVAGRPPFDKKAEDVAHLVTLYYQYFQIVAPADSGIKTVADLKGKSIAVQPRGNTGEQMTRDILQVYGLSYDDMKKVNHGSYNDAVELIKNRQADAFTLITTVPASSVMDLATARKIRLISIPQDKLDEVRKINSGYAPRTIKAGTYPDQSEDVTTFGTYTHIIASKKLQPELVAKITELLVKNRDKLAAVVTDIKDTTERDMAADVGVPFHPAAAAFFKK